MKIILVATGEKGRNVVFVSDALQLYPQANERGTQIANEFYQFAREWLQ